MICLIHLVFNPNINNIWLIFYSGQEVGTLCSNISLRINQAHVQSKVRKTSKEPLLDIEDEEANVDPWAGFTFSNEVGHLIFIFYSSCFFFLF